MRYEIRYKGFSDFYNIPMRLKYLNTIKSTQVESEFISKICYDCAGKVASYELRRLREIVKNQQ